MAGTAPLPGGAQALADEGGLQGRARGPADQSARGQVEEAGQIQPALPGGDVGDVAQPHLVGHARRAPMQQQVRTHRPTVTAVGRAGARRPSSVAPPTPARACAGPPGSRCTRRPGPATPASRADCRSGPGGFGKLAGSRRPAPRWIGPAAGAPPSASRNSRCGSRATPGTSRSPDTGLAAPSLRHTFRRGFREDAAGFF